MGQELHSFSIFGTSHAGLYKLQRSLATVIWRLALQVIPELFRHIVYKNVATTAVSKEVKKHSV